jgi:hypothetical protein
MHLRLFRHTTRRREFDEEHQPRKRPESTDNGRQRRVVAPTGAVAMRTREAESEWPWWLSSPTSESASWGPGLAGEVDAGRRWSLRQDDSDEPTLRPAA